MLEERTPYPNLAILSVQEGNAAGCHSEAICLNSFHNIIEAEKSNVDVAQHSTTLQLAIVCLTAMLVDIVQDCSPHDVRNNDKHLRQELFRLSA